MQRPVDLSFFREDVDLAITLTLPDDSSHESNVSRALHEFARHMKGIGLKSGAHCEDFEPYVEEWYFQAFGDNPPTPFEQIMLEFEDLYDRVEIPYETHTLVEAIKTARNYSPQNYYPRYPSLNFLIEICWALQSQSQVGETFFLSCRSVGKIFDISKQQGSIMLKRLREDGRLILLKKGSFGRASEYRCSG